MFRVAEKKTKSDDESSDLARFIRETLTPISQAFAASPLMQLRVKTPQGSVTLAKRAQAQVDAQLSAEGSQTTKHPQARLAPAARIYNGEVGRAYETITAGVVGVFRDVAEPPSSGDHLEAGRLLGHIEALRLRNEVRCPIDCTLIAQVVVDGQSVDFGETLFAVDTGSAALLQDAEMFEVAEAVEALEPPRV